ncbi:MAG: type II toxin-antitoxin system RelE/ParE family toxin [Promethearchaeota archaeon]|nr:MAG: type II toxin-antitoxin system RelE/ParE family toxin [Candidatus Lokiarchaeota archaeon]
MVKLNYDSRALEDLNLIYHYLKRNSPNYAKTIITKIKERIRTLKDFPKMGRIVPEIEKTEFRELIEQGYRIVYQLNGTIIILTIFHSRERFPLDL